MSNVNPINRVPFGQEKTREEFLARAAWEYDQASRLRLARKPIGYTALVEGHERTARDYERAAEGRPSKARTSRAHATIAGAPGGSKRSAKTKIVHVVQGNYGYGHGWEDLTAEDTRKEALARLREYRENEAGPFRLIRRRERIEGAGGTAHARRKKLDPREAKQLLKSDGIDFGRDFHELGSQEVERILEVARLAGYRKRRDAPGSTARMYFQYLSRQP
jgi:hypothetical protein